jgi:CheY-like chemotaxis protein
MHELVFERFMQVDSSATRKFGGAGLGLSLSKGYVELLGGHISINSELGKGSVFTFRIPYKPVIRPEIKSARKYPSSTIAIPPDTTVLIVEDDHNNFLLAKNLLTSLKINVLHAENGEEAIEICKKGPLPSLVLMDIRMPVMDGLDSLKIIRQLYPGLPVIAVTAYANDKDRHRFLEAGFNDYIVKPVDKRVLYKKMERFFTD